MVSSSMLVVVYVPLLHLLFLLLPTRLDIGVGRVHDVSPVVGTQVHSCGLNEADVVDSAHASSKAWWQQEE